MTIGCQVFVDGVRVVDGSPGDPYVALSVLDGSPGMSISWGRTSTVDQLDPATAVFKLLDMQRTGAAAFGAVVQIGRQVQVRAPNRASPGTPAVVVFDGQITDIVASLDDATGYTAYTVTAVDAVGDLGNRTVGAAWGAETLGGRARRVLSASRMGGDMSISIPSTRAGLTVTRRPEADGATAADLLRELAASIDGALWVGTAPAAGAVPQLVIGAAVDRPALHRLAKPGTYVIIVTATDVPGLLQLTACDPDLEPISWHQSMTDLVTGVKISYQDQSGAPAAPTAVSVTIADPVLEGAAHPWGVARLTVDTVLTTVADVTDVAAGILARLSVASWIFDNVVVEPNSLTAATALTLLDSSVRFGRPVGITDVPDWSPVPGDFTGFLEGGDYDYSGDAWSLSLNLSNAQSYGASLRWTDVNAAWRWTDFHPSISWADLNGVGI